MGMNVCAERAVGAEICLLLAVICYPLSSKGNVTGLGTNNLKTNKHTETDNFIRKCHLIFWHRSSIEWSIDGNLEKDFHKGAIGHVLFREPYVCAEELARVHSAESSPTDAIGL